MYTDNRRLIIFLPINKLQTCDYYFTNELFILCFINFLLFICRTMQTKNFIGRKQ
jgi:hypothetical protein